MWNTGLSDSASRARDYNIRSIVAVTKLKGNIMEDDNTIPMDEPLRSFKNFLDQENNRRIFLSGKFGSGKTFFLDEFFKQNAKDYDVYYLFPIRYQILENEDIINLIKYDILVSIFEKSSKSKPIEVNLKEQIKNFSQYLDWGKLIEAVPKLGRHLLLTKDIYNTWVKAKKDSSQQRLIEFQETIEKQLASSLDILLRQQIQELRGKTKKSVLVLDDLDRMDPEHIFRMLNILSARMELDEVNELGFDHIILAGDMENIRHIFHHKYGERTDFQGYFDKFSTNRPYFFNNAKAIVNWIQNEMFKSVRQHTDLVNSMGSAGRLRIPLEEILKQLIKAKALNLRQLYKPVRHLLPELSKGVRRDPFTDDSLGPELHLGRSLELLIALFEGSKEKFIGALEKIKEQGLNSSIKIFKDVRYDYRAYSTTWSIIQDPQSPLDKPEENVTLGLFYEYLIRYVRSNCQDGSKN